MSAAPKPEGLMDMDLLRYAAAERSIAARKFAARAEASTHNERAARFRTAMILTVFGLGCADLGVLTALAAMLGHL